jgi:hypothetical protein
MTVTISVRMPASLAARLDSLARARQSNRSAILRELAEQAAVKNRPRFACLDYPERFDLPDLRHRKAWLRNTLRTEYADAH